MQSSVIKSFSINGLFGTKNVHIPFEENVKILIGENGLGKTQTLNLLYYTLTQNFYRLNQFRFDSIELVLSDTVVLIEKDKLNESIAEMYKHPIVQQVISSLGITEFERFLNKYDENEKKREELEYFMNKEYRRSGLSSHTIFRAIERVREIEKEEKGEYLDAIKKQIKGNLDSSTLMYFPIWRRIEDASQNIGYSEVRNEETDDTKIQFGMQDVQNRFKSIENQIKRLMIDGIIDLSSEILNQVFEDDDDAANDTFFNDFSEKDIEILFARVGTNIADNKKQAIIDLLFSKRINTKDNTLKFMLKKLIDIYGKQKDIDNAIIKFRDICNTYLIEKVVIYDQKNIKIQIKSTINDEIILLSNLSSGERQIISIFARIHLFLKKANLTILIDEPELNLSIFWQKTFLPDILQSGNVRFLLATTHSPFIFEDKSVQFNTVALSAYIEPSKPLVLQ